MNEQLQKALQHWDYVSAMIERPKSQDDYEALVQNMEDAMEISMGKPDSPLNGIIEAMAHAIKEYEKDNIIVSTGGGIAALKYLMKLHKIKQSELKEVGSQGVVSEILNGKRSLTVRHIKALS